MSLRISPRTRALFVVIAVALMTSHSWAVWYALGPSKDEWGLKYDGEVDATSGDKLTVRFTIADQGRLKTIHSVFMMVFSNSNRTGTNLVKTNFEMKPTQDGKLSGQAEVEKKYADRAVIRVFTMNVDGKSLTTGPTAGARYYDVPLSKFMKKAPSTISSRFKPSSIAKSALKVAE